MQAARAMSRGVPSRYGRKILCPLADGGDGTLASLREPLKLKIYSSRVLDPRARSHRALWGYNATKRLAVIEMAQASGLALLKKRDQNPMQTTSYGVGQLMTAALEKGAKEIWVCLGGSATVDGGMGILQALGARVMLSTGELHRPFQGADLNRLAEVDPSPVLKILKGVRLRVLCDVANLLLGPRGAARAFGPQKGARPAEVRKLEKGLRRMLGLIPKEKKGVGYKAGAGAAGGAAAGLVGFINAHQEKGTETIFRLIGLERQVQRADVVFTGEGCVDRSSWEGKSLGPLVRLCRRYNKLLIVLAGRIGSGGRRQGVRVIPLGGIQMGQEEKMRKVKKLIEIAAGDQIDALLN